METKDKLFIGVFVAAIIGFAFLISPVAATNPPTEDGLGPYRDYTMKVAPIEPTVVTEGTLYIRVLCENNIFTKEVVIQEVQPTTGTFVVANGLVDPKVVAANFAPVGGERTFALRADGTADTQIPAGTYTATVADGNGGQPEVILFAVKPTQTVKIAFLGHAFTAAVEEEQRVVVIERATYGKIITVIDQPAYDTTDYEAGHVHARPTHGFAPHDFRIGGQKYQITGNHHDGGYIVYNYFNARPANIVTTHHAAVTHEEGQIIDVTAAVQAAADAGEFNIVFDNAKQPGGLFDDEGNLLTQIADPAVGIVKDVVIIADGVTINAHEYEVINL